MFSNDYLSTFHAPYAGDGDNFYLAPEAAEDDEFMIKRVYRLANRSYGHAWLHDAKGIFDVRQG